MTSIIVDDESNARIGLKAQMNRIFPAIKILDTCDSVESGYKSIVKLKPDIVFLDIEMLDGTGFDLLGKFKKVDFHVIFVTAYDQYALQAFRFSAVDYLMKPVNPDELAQAVDKIWRFRDQKNQNNQLDILISNLKQQHIQNLKLAIPQIGKVSYVKLSEIVYLEADGAYTIFHLNKGKTIVSARTLKHFIETLQGKNFFRTHRSFMVNLHLVEEFSSRDGGEATMQNGHQILVAQNKKKLFLEALSDDFTK